MCFTSPDIKNIDKFKLVFVKLFKLSSNNIFKNTLKITGCKIWIDKINRDQITGDEDNVIKEKRYLMFQIKDIDSAVGMGGFDLSIVGSFRMHEYNSNKVNAGLDSNITVFCKINHS